MAFAVEKDTDAAVVPKLDTARLADAGIEPSVGSVGDSYDNAWPKPSTDFTSAEVIHRRGPWRSFEAVEFATLQWVDTGPNNRRLMEPHRLHPAGRSRASADRATLDRPANGQRADSNQTASDKPGRVHVVVARKFRCLVLLPISLLQSSGPLVARTWPARPQDATSGLVDADLVSLCLMQHATLVPADRA